MIISVLFALWEAAITMCNASTFIYLLKHPTLYIVLVVAYFAITILLKFSSAICGVVAVLNTIKGGFMDKVYTTELILCGISTAGFVAFLLWSWTNLSLGTNIALILDGALYIITTLFAFFVGRKPAETYRYVVLQQYPKYTQP